MDLTNPQIIMRDKENARLREDLAAAQATIAEMNSALATAQDVLELEGYEQEAKKVSAAMIKGVSFDALHEDRARECERLKTRWLNSPHLYSWLDEEAAAHRARKQATKEEEK